MDIWSETLLFESDRKRFSEILWNEDRAERIAGLRNLEDFATCEIMRYGAFRRDDMVQPLAELYRDHVMKLPEARRGVILQKIQWATQTTDFVSASAFLPFIGEEASRRIAGCAAADFAISPPAYADDPMGRLKGIIQMIEDGIPANVGGVFGGLLTLGDSRVCRLLRPLRDSLELDEVRQAIHSYTPYIHTARVEFYLDWLEGCDPEDELFGIVASGLALLKWNSPHEAVFTGERPFPTPRDVYREDWASPMPLKQYAERIASRLYALERTEPAPRVMPHVLEAWGLPPRSYKSEAIVLDARSEFAPPPATPAILYNQALEQVRGEWWGGEGWLYLMWGHLTLDGPSLYCVGSREDGKTRRTFLRWLQPRGGATLYAQETETPLTLEALCDDFRSISKWMRANNDLAPLARAPTFLIVNGDNDVIAPLAARFILEHYEGEDWGRVLALHRHFGADILGWFGAVNREMYVRRLEEARNKDEPDEVLGLIESRYGHLPEFRHAWVPTWMPSQLTPELFAEWFEAVLKPEHSQGSPVWLQGSVGERLWARRRGCFPVHAMGQGGGLPNPVRLAIVATMQ